MRRIILAAAFAAAAIATPAIASTLVLYDVPSDQARRVFDQIYPEQAIARETRNGMLRPMEAAVGEGGVRRTTVIDVFDPGPPPNLGLGVKVLRERVSWQVTAERVGDEISYEAVLRASRGFESSLTTPSDASSTTVTLVGVGRTDAQGPVIFRQYSTPTGSRTLVGYLRN